MVQVAEIVGVKALPAHAISEETHRFYVARRFIESPTDRMTLCLPVASFRNALTE